MKKLFLLLFIGLFITYNGCKEDKPTEPEPDPTPSDVIISKTTKVIDSTDYNADLISISNDSSKFTFKNNFNSKYNPSIDNILVITNGNGLLRKITDIQTSGNEVIITTTQGTLRDVIEKGKISFRQSLQKARINSAKSYYDGITYKLNKKGEKSNIDFVIDVVLYDLDGNLNTTDDQVKLVGNFVISADLV